MSKKLTSKQMKGTEKLFTPVSVAGVVVPKRASGRDSETAFNLVTLTGVEYSILADQEWQLVLETYRWEEVRVRGLLNIATMTIVPHWVVPRGPTGETQRVTDKPLAKSGDLIGKIKKTVADLVLAPSYA